MQHAIAILVSVPLIMALGCGPDQPPAADEPISPAGDLTIPSASAEATAGSSRTKADAGQLKKIGRGGGGEVSPKPLAKADGGTCSWNRREVSWEVRAGAKAYLEDGTVAGKTPERVMPIRCAKPETIDGRGCFHATKVHFVQTNQSRVCFDERDVTELFRQPDQRGTPECEITMGEPEIKGPFSASVLERLVANQAEPIGWCVAKEARVGVDLDETIVLTFKVVPKNAQLQDVKIKSRKLSDEAQLCIRRRFEHERFPVIKLDEETRVKAKIEVQTFVPEARQETDDENE